MKQTDNSTGTQDGGFGAPPWLGNHGFKSLTAEDRLKMIASECEAAVSVLRLVSYTPSPTPPNDKLTPLPPRATVGGTENFMSEAKSIGSETPTAEIERLRAAGSDLLAGVEQLTKPDFHKLNVHAGRNDRLLHAVLCAYAKHHLDCDDIGWNQLGEILHDAICNEIGDDKYCAWADLIKKD